MKQSRSFSPHPQEATASASVAYTANSPRIPHILNVFDTKFDGFTSLAVPPAFDDMRSAFTIDPIPDESRYGIASMSRTR